MGASQISMRLYAVVLAGAFALTLVLRAPDSTAANVPGCIPDGGSDDTLRLTDCCSGIAVPGSTTCTDPNDFGTTWATCTQTCGSGTGPPSGGNPQGPVGCIGNGGTDDTLYSTHCCSGMAVPGSTVCSNPADYGTTWASCTQTCAGGTTTSCTQPTCNAPPAGCQYVAPFSLDADGCPTDCGQVDCSGGNPPGPGVPPGPVTPGAAPVCLPTIGEVRYTVRWNDGSGNQSANDQMFSPIVGVIPFDPAVVRAASKMPWEMSP